MQKVVFFDDWRGKFWPSLKELEPYFLTPGAQGWRLAGRNSSGSLKLEGLEGSEALPYFQGRKDVHFIMYGLPVYGVLIIYRKIGPGGFSDAFTSKGDMSRLGEIVRSLEDTPLPVGLFIPFDRAWAALKEFMATEGQLPKCIEWVRNADLPANTFPDP